ncbi:teichoic acid D-Ala incorporation-associated protein DltX [Paucilactobacillus suebicus]|nr:teichoic acid D-Ala incorporation-associated protein DltX [Paucilactobacillus suebicus]
MAWLSQPVSQFVLKTIFYFVALLIIIYLYGYSGVNNSGFIYNEF